MATPLSITGTDFKIGNLYNGHMKLFKMFISPMGIETFTHVTQSKSEVK